MTLAEAIWFNMAVLAIAGIAVTVMAVRAHKKEEGTAKHPRARR